MHSYLSIKEVQKTNFYPFHRICPNNLAQLDIGREIRKGGPEVVFAEGKEDPDIVRIVLSAINKKEKVMVSRIRRDELSKLWEEI